MRMTEITFIADVMVGKLARWLRVLGFDVTYSNTLQDDEIMQIAAAEDRIILTRDVAFAERCQKKHRILFIEHNDWQSQLGQVVNAFGLKDFRILSRCIECNAYLQAVEKEVLAERVPPYVYQTQEHFSVCSSCGRVFWRGTHVEAILRVIPRAS